MDNIVKKRSLTISGHRTSISLENAYWQALTDLAHAQGKTISTVVTEIDQARGEGGLSSAIRVHLLEYFRRQAKSL